jgi:hypothetical protein
MHPTLIIQELQTIKCIKQHNISYKLLIKLDIYVMTAANKRYSYLKVATIQIDVHSAGENL